MTITGTISKQQRPNGQGSYYQLTTEGGAIFAINMTESTKPADDVKVFGPLISKRVEADGILQQSTKTFMAFSVRIPEAP